MKLKIGDTIRELRKENHMTQEQLAASLGISFQAVSKWENNITLPDVTLIPQLAQIFCVNTDKIFSFSQTQIETETIKIVAESAKYRDTQLEKGIAILKAGLKQYPNNEILLNAMLYVMDFKKNPDATIRLSNRIIKKTTNSEIRYDALRFLAYAYKAKGDVGNAISAIEQIPEIYFTKLSELAAVASGKTKYEAALAQQCISFRIMLEMMRYKFEFYLEEGNDTLAYSEAKKAKNLIALFQNEEDFLKEAQESIDFFHNIASRDAF